MTEKIKCRVCPRGCELTEGAYGYCRARANRNGRVVAASYGRITSASLDPIEKKPLRRFYPGSMILSVGSFGCNLSCPFCQNYEISMAGPEMRTFGTSPQALAAKAVELADGVQVTGACDAQDSPAFGNLGIAYTYNEPLVGYEFVRDCAKLVHEAGLKNVLVTNGLAESEILNELLPYIDAMNIDLKAFCAGYYDWISGGLSGALDVVKQTIRRAAGCCHVEVTTLIVPGRNDSSGEMSAESEWLASIDPEIPLHISRFFPRYRFTECGPTPVVRIRELCDVAGRSLKYVYPGNC